MRHVRAVAERPHPTGSIENARVRDYLVAELRGLGLETEVQAGEAVAPSRRAGGATVVARVENVVARLKGTGGGGALMLAAHYDSVPTAPGATDDAAGVAAVLETLRALVAGPPPERDIVALFTDAEELGLLGARLFVAEHPWMKDVALVLNFEGRGAVGPSMMFETSAGNVRLVAELAAWAPRPVANSLMYEGYRRLPNDTDMTVFKAAGAAGLNFSHAERLTHYHTALDSADELDERSLQHHGSYALALARRFGGLDLRDLKEDDDAVFFNLFGPILIHYPVAWAAPFTLAVLAAFAAVVMLGLRRRRLSVAGLTAGAFALLLSAALAGLLAAGAWRAAKALHAGFESLPWQTPYELRLYELGCVFLTLAATSGVYAFLFRRVPARELLAGALVWWALGLVSATVLVPAGSYLFAWPLLFALGGLAFSILRGTGEAETGDGSGDGTTDGASDQTGDEMSDETAGGLVVMALCAAPAVALVAPLIYLLVMMMGLDPVGLMAVLIVLALGPAVSLLRRAWGGRRWSLTGAAALVALSLFVAAVSTAGFDARRKKINHLFYQLDADAGQASWVSMDRERDEWTAQFITGSAQRVEPEAWRQWGRRQVWQDTAPALPLTAPVLEVIEDRTEGEVRRARLRVASQRGAQGVMVSATAAGIRSAQVNGRAAWTALDDGGADASPAAGGASTAGAAAGGVRTAEPALLRLTYAAPPAEGFELSIEARAGVPLVLVVEDFTFGLPAEALLGRRPRQAHMMPAPNYRWSDATVVRRVFELPATTAR
jgi:hypothetical protein